MATVCVIGHFGYGKNMLNGQTIKTKNLTKALIDMLGNKSIFTIDTHGGFMYIPNIILKTVVAVFKYQNVIILPAHNGIKIFVPLLSFLSKLTSCKMHYVVIGGWLPEFLEHRELLSRCLKSFTGIYVETKLMKSKLQAKGFKNVEVMPNFKDIKILKEEELIYSTKKPYKLCTFSRVMKEKGIEDAVEAVKNINKESQFILFYLDIYGQIDKEQIDWFHNLKASFPVFIRYQGMAPCEKSVEILKNYVALLFPTYYDGEGFAGTIIDAFAAGVPVIASDWRYNSEIIRPYVNGILVKHKNSGDIVNVLRYIAENIDKWNEMKLGCLKESANYLPSNALKKIINNIR